MTVHNGNFDPIPPNIYTPAYCSEYVTVNSKASSAEYNVFDDGNYVAFAHTSLVTAAGITFDHAAGTFTVAAAGKYKLEVLAVAVNSNSSGTINYFRVYVDAVEVHESVFFWTGGIRSHVVPLILDLTAGQAVSITVENNGVTATTTIQAGTTCSLERVA